MSTSKVIGLNAYANALRKELTEYWVNEQTQRLIEYAKEKILRIGGTIQTYHSRHHMDRTGNLLNSLCWGVAYDGKLMDYGFYRDAESINTSYVHEWFKEDWQIPVNGHALADEYIARYGKMSGPNMWRVFFAILAPYWGYWEEGFTMVNGYSKKGSFMGSTFVKFAVMSEVYDQVAKELSPAKTKIQVHVEEYTKPYMIGKTKIKGSLQRRWDRLEGNPQYQRKR